MVKDSSGKPRGYAFIEFERERDMHSEYCVFLSLNLRFMSRGVQFPILPNSNLHFQIRK